MYIHVQDTHCMCVCVCQVNDEDMVNATHTEAVTVLKNTLEQHEGEVSTDSVSRGVGGHAR